MKSDLMAFGAHPDDTELACSGTLASLIQKGSVVVVADLTRGEMGSRGTPELRLQEAEEAAGILGLAKRVNLGLPDTRLMNIRENQLPIIETVRSLRPHVCLIPAPADRHPDHVHASTLLLDALFYSGLAKIETQDPEGQIQEPYRPVHILHYIQDDFLQPDFVYDISDTFHLKEKAIAAFASQFNVADPGDEPATYISDPAFIESVRARARLLGHMGGYTYGEGFISAKKPVPLSS
ncbi:MAG: bacillithiol biosynthesis deacetylase BshB1, partial [Balneolaceae bacterium]